MRRSDGQMIQIDPLMNLIVENIDGSRSFDEIAEQVTDGYGREVSGDNVKTLVDKSLRPDGIVAGPDGVSPHLEKPDPLLQLKARATILPEGPVNVIAGLLRPLFWPPVILAVLAGLVALDVWYFGSHGVGQGMRDLLYQPLTALLVYALLILSVGWHELGHATAAKYGGARPGKIGFGIYVIWPAFYTDVTDVYRLGKAGRVRTDLGGVYFNAIFVLMIGGLYFLTGFEPLLILIVIQHMLMLYQFMPFLRMDGYYVIADSTGVPDLFGRLKPTLKSVVPGKETPKQVKELKKWVRVVVTIWVATVIPVLLFMFGMMVISAPRVISTGWDSFWVQVGMMKESLSGGKFAGVAVGVIQILLLVLPLTGMGFTFTRILKRIGTGLAKVRESRPALGFALSGAGVLAVVFAAFVLWPNGEYKPIQEDERWTASHAVEAISEVGTGRPSLSEEAEKELEGAPSEAENVPGLADPEAEPSPDAKQSLNGGGVDPSPQTRTSPSPEPEPEASPEAQQ